MKNEKIMKILNNIRRLKEKPGFNLGWNCCLDTLLMDFREELKEELEESKVYWCPTCGTHRDEEYTRKENNKIYCTDCESVIARTKQ